MASNLSAELAPADCGVLEVAGCPIAYEVRGEGAPVVFVQGVGVAGSGWRPQIDFLAARFRCLSFDHRGLGASLPAGAATSVERLALDAAALVDHLGWASAHFVGHSLGGQVALELALAARARVRSLALLCTFARGRDALAITPSKLWTGLRTYVGTRRMRRLAFLEMVCAVSELAGADLDRLGAEIGLLFGRDLADHPSIEMEQLRALGRYDAGPRLSALVGIPALVVAAAEDRIAPPASGRRLAANIPGARYVEFPSAAHGLPILHRNEVNRLLAEHLAGADA